MSALAVGFTGSAGVQQGSGIHLATLSRASARQLGGIGAVADAVQDPRGRIVLLDAERFSVVVADSQLRVLGSLTPGGGDSLFRWPVALALLGDDRVAVLDRLLQTVRIIALRDGGRRLVHAGSVPLPMAAEWLCALPRDRLLVYGFHRGSRLHVISLPGGRILRSFAPGDTTLPDNAQERFVRGRMACDASRDEVVITSVYRPTVQAFRISDGAATWTDTLRPFRPLSITVSGGRTTMRSGPGGYSRVLSALRIGPCRMFQAIFDGRTDHGADTTLTYLNRGETGRWRTASVGPPLLLQLGAGRALTASVRDSTVQVVRLAVDDCHTPEGPPPR